MKVTLSVITAGVVRTHAQENELEYSGYKTTMAELLKEFKVVKRS